MKKFIFGTMVAVLLSSCGNRQKELLQFEIAGDVQDEVYLTAIPVNEPDSLLADTLTLQNGKLQWNMELGAPTEITMEFGKDRKAFGRRKPASSEAYRIHFLLQPGEKVRIKAGYEENFLNYELTGSEALKVQSDLRKQMRAECVQIGLLYDQLCVEMAKGVENLVESYVDSLYDLFGETNIQRANAHLAYVKTNPEKILSAWFLLKHPVRDTFLNCVVLLDSTLFGGVLGERLQQARENAEKMRIMSQNAERISSGAIAPDFTLTDLNGKTVKLSDYAGKYVVLDFWGTWCVWCVKGIPQMKQYYEKHKKNVVFLSIACRDKEEKVKAFVEKESIKWLNVMNGTDAQDVAFQYGVSGFPTKIILEPGLKVKNRYLGEVPEFYQDLDNIK